MVVFKSLVLLLLVVVSVCQLSAAAPQPREEEEAALSLAAAAAAAVVGGGEVLERNRRGVDCTSTQTFGSTSTSYTFFTDAPSGCQCDNDITKIYLRHDDFYIRQLQVTAVTAAGSEIAYAGRGSITTGYAELIEFAEGEKLIGATGYYHSTVAVQLTFFSITAEGIIHVYGPYGDISPASSTYTYFSVFGKINGFFGRSDTAYLRGIGFYYEGEGLYATRT